MSSIQRVAIVGAGLSGLACAAAVAQAGVSVQVFAAESIDEVQPLHLDAVPNLVRSLDRLGILAQCQRLGFAYSRVRTTDAYGRTIDTLPLARLAGDSKPAGLGLLYGDLVRVLVSVATGQGAQLHPFTRVVAVDAEKGQVHLANASTAHADLVLLAAGVNTSLRQALFSHAPTATHHDQDWLHVVLPRSQGLDHPTWAIGQGGHKLHVVPIGATKAGLTLCASGTFVNGEPQPAQAMLQALRGFSGWPVAWTEVLNQNPPLTVHGVREALLPSPWYRGRVLAVGDCSHALVPHFGQGPAQALEDAVVLHELLVQGLPLTDLTTRFTERRLKRLQQVHALTSRAARWDQHPDPSTDLRALAQLLAHVVAEPA